MEDEGKSSIFTLKLLLREKTRRLRLGPPFLKLRQHWWSQPSIGVDGIQPLQLKIALAKVLLKAHGFTYLKYDNLQLPSPGRI
jgi:hypothetical protein